MAQIGINDVFKDNHATKKGPLRMCLELKMQQVRYVLASWALADCRVKSKRFQIKNMVWVMY